MNVLSENHWRLEDYRQRMTVREWEKVLLDEHDKLVFRGHIRQLKAKSLGAGVVEVCKVSLESKP